MSRGKKLAELRAEAERANRAVREEEDRQRDEYNDALEVLLKEVEEHLSRAGCVVGLGSRKHVRSVKARPGWRKTDTLRLDFAFAEEFTHDIHEDPMNTAVCLIWVPTGEMCRFNCPPEVGVLIAVVDAYMGLAGTE